MINKSAEEVYDEMCCNGEFKEYSLDIEQIKNLLKLSISDSEFIKRIKKIDNPNYRVIFTNTYEVLTELFCILMMLKKQITSNNRGLFAFVIIKYPELELDFEFFETIRTMHELNRLEGADILKEKWRSVEFRIESCIMILKNEIEKRVNQL